MYASKFWPAWKTITLGLFDIKSALVAAVASSE